MTAENEGMRRTDREALRRRRVMKRRRRRALFVVSLVVVLGLAVGLLGPWGPLSVFGKKNGKNPGPGTASAPDPGQNDTSTRSSQPAAASSASAPSVTSTRVEKLSNPIPPAVAIVVDDVGNTDEMLPAWLSIDAPIDFAVMPYPPLSEELANKLYDAGYLIMMHIPTQNAPPNSFSGKGQLEVGMDRSTVFNTLNTDITTVPHAEGVNNHQGGRGCDDNALMTSEVEWAKERGLFVVDSASSVNSQVTKACLALGMGKRLNQVFIDHENDPDYLRKSMRELAALARKNGTAIGICHWHRPFTASTVKEMMLVLGAEGIHFCFARDITN